MTNIATIAVAMVGSVLAVSWLTWRLVRGVPDGYDSETEVKTPLVTIRRKVQRSQRCNHDAAAVQTRLNELDADVVNNLPETRTDLEAIRNRNSQR
jgi:hypothetical protein